MGVLGLWQLLAPVGQPVTLESLENKIFAVDISIWLNQALKGYRDSQGGSVPNAHLLSLFSRLCKLLFYKIRPIIVFDGGYPELKKQTIINRQQRRAAIKQRSRDIGLKILTNYLASKNLAKASGSESSSQQIIKPKEKVRDEIFKLPPLPVPDTSMDGGYETSDSADLIEWKFTDFSKEDIKYLNQIDINSEDFDNLPPDVKQEILSTLKESRKHRTWEQSAELPKESNKFSSYQMQCLLKKRNLSKKLEEVQKDLRKINSANFVAQYTNDHVIGETNKIMSDDCSHYVLLKKIMSKSESDSTDKFEKEAANSITIIDSKNAFIKDMENIDIYEIKESEMITKTENKNSVFDTNSIKIKQELDFFDEEDVDDPLEIQIVSNSETSPGKAVDFKTTAVNKNDYVALESPLDEKNLKSDEVSKITDVEKRSEGEKLNDSSNSVNMSEISKTGGDDSNLIRDEKELIDISSENIMFDAFKAKEKSSVLADASSSEDDFIPCDDSEKLLLKRTNMQNKNSVQTTECTNAEEPFTTTSFTDPHFISESQTISKEGITVNSNFTKDLPSVASSTSSLQNISKEEENTILQQLQSDLDSATNILEADQAKQDRQNRTVQEHMVEECKELLQLFGIPYIVSPTEAEAQCAFYDIVGLTHGTITDDSDVWLFGGKKVYKNFFTQHKYVEFYKDNEVFNHFNLSRKKLINFALLTGSDYTEGIEGVGPVTAMEILSEFPGEDIEALQKFKEWWSDVNKNIRSPENKVRAKLKKLVLSWNFPDEKIVDAYLNPAVDDSTEKFSWGRPDLDALREYTRERFGWNKSKVDDALLPVIKKLNERESQTHIDNFFTVNLKKQNDLFPSKRIMSALKKMTSPQKANGQELSSTSKRKSRESKKETTKKLKRKVPTKEKKSRTKIQEQEPMLSEESSDES